MYKIKSISLIGETARTSNSYGSNLSYRRYRVLLDGKTSIEDVYTKEQLKKLSYWSSRSEKMAMTCWGTSQLFEAQLALARFMGWGQKKGEEWGDFTQRATSLIKEL